MRRKLIVALAVGVLFLITTGTAMADLKEYIGIIRPEFNAQTKQLFLDLTDYFKKNNQADMADYFSNWSKGAWHGSGWVLVDSDGANYIITNRHVAQQAERIDFQLEQPDGSMKSFNDCPILWVDDDVDLAVAQFPNGQKVYGKSFPINMDIQPDGQEVWSAGFPGLLGQAGWQFAKGNITNSQARVPQLIDPKISYVIQHSASIDPGNSGGPLLLKNEKSPVGFDVVGVNTWSIRTRQNTFFSIPTKAIRLILDKAKAAKAIHEDPEKMKARLVKDANILAAELGSETRDYNRLMKFISYAFVGNLGWAAWKADVATMATAQEQSDSQKKFVDEPIETMRYSIFRVFLAEMLLRSNNNLSSLAFQGINAADEDKIGEDQLIRTNFTMKDEKVEVQWVYEYGDWRISYVNMKKFAELLSGGTGGTTTTAGTTGSSGGGGGQVFVSSKKIGLELLGGVGWKSGSGATYNLSGIDNSAGLGWCAGLLLDVPFMPFLGVSTGLFVTSTGSSFTDNSTGNVWDTSLLYLEVPLLLKAGLPFQVSRWEIFEIYVSGGVGFNYNLSQSGTINDSYGTQLGTFTWNGLNSIAFSAIASLGLEYTIGSTAFGTTLRYDRHLGSDTSSTYTEKIHGNLLFDFYMKFLF